MLFEGAQAVANMTIAAKLLLKLQSLPEEQRAQVLDFIERLPAAELRPRPLVDPIGMFAGYDTTERLRLADPFALRLPLAFARRCKIPEAAILAEEAGGGYLKFWAFPALDKRSNESKTEVKEDPHSAARDSGAARPGGCPRR
jgi:hypothetical protein